MSGRYAVKTRYHTDCELRDEIMALETILAETYLGNVGERDELALSVARSQEDNLCLEVTIERSDRAKGRILTQTVSGQKVGIVKNRDWILKDGDVFALEGNRLLLVGIQSQTVIALTFVDDVQGDPAALIQLGHVLGNRHWPVAVREKTLYIELVAEAALVESTIRETATRLDIKGLKIEQINRTAQNALDFHTDSHHH